MTTFHKRKGITMEKKAPRYKVEFRKLSNNEWYTKTVTDHLPSAYSVARVASCGRAGRIVDTEENRIIDEWEKY